jgi:hypothetical protein
MVRIFLAGCKPGRPVIKLAVRYDPLTASTSVFPEICVYRFSICVDLCPVMACTVIMGKPFSQNRLVASWRKSWKVSPTIPARAMALIEMGTQDLHMGECGLVKGRQKISLGSRQRGYHGQHPSQRPQQRLVMLHKDCRITSDHARKARK